MTAAKLAPSTSMYLLGVIPITKEPLKEELSYFSRKEIPIGTLVEIPLRSRELFALVVSCESVLDMKSALKNAPYAIKKIESVKEGRVFDAPFVAAAARTADYFATGMGNVLRSSIPEEILLKWEGTDGDTPASKGIHETYLLQAPFYERISVYRGMIREEFAKKLSIMTIVPNKTFAATLVSEMAKGIEEYAIMLHGDLSKKEMLESWRRAVESTHPVLIVATPGFLSLPRSDIGTYILEHESSPGYKSRFRPFLDARILARNLAKERGGRIVHADTFLTLESLEKREAKTALPLGPLKNRQIAGGETALIDLKNKKDRKTDYFLSDELLTLITQTVARDQHVYLFAARKGIAPLTICNDCGTNLTCPDCERPLTLHAKKIPLREEIKNVYICHSCTKEYSADIRCAHCKSWRLMPLGVGVEKIADTIADLYPDVPLYRIDGDSTKTAKQALEMAEGFRKGLAGILIGTEMSLPYVESTHVSAVVSIDNLFAIPDFKIAERLMHFFVEIREKTEGAMIIQTRKPEMRVFAHATRGTLSDFYREEMESRKKYSYPPYSLFIKVTREGKAVEVEEDMRLFEELFAAYSPELFSGFHIPAPGEEKLHALIRLDPAEWPDKKVTDMLKSLSPAYLVEIAPEGLL